MSADLIKKLERAKSGSNELDVLIEVALFKPDDECVSCRANNAGTKVIYTRRDGSERTYCAYEWTREPLKSRALIILKAIHQKETTT